MNKSVGSSFDEFLVNEGLFLEAQDYAIQKMISWQSRQETEDQRLLKSKMASRKSDSEPS